MSRDGKRKLELPTQKSVKPVGHSRPLGEVLSPKDFDSKVIPAKYARRRIHAYQSAARYGYFADHESAARAMNWTGRHNTGEPRDLRRMFWIKERNAEGKPIKFEAYSQIQEEFVKVIKKLREKTNHPGILEHQEGIELSQLEKVGPKSQFKPYYMSKLHERVEELMRDTNNIFVEDRPLNLTVDYLRNLLGKGTVRLESLDVVWNTLPQEDDAGDINAPSLDFTTNAGPDTYVRKWRDLTGEDKYRVAVAKRIYDTAKYYGKQLEVGRPVPWRSMMAHRLTTGGPKDFDTKERPVIAMEKANAVCGKRVTYHLLDALRANRSGLKGFSGAPFIALFDKPYIDVEMNMLLEYQAANNDVVINSSDVSAFDSSANSNLIMLAGEIVGYWMRGGQKYVRALAESMACHTSVMTPLGFYDPAGGGMKSGDGLTNLLDSVMSLIVFWYGHFAGAYDMYGAYAQGDDGLQIGRGITPENISDVYSVFGFDANPTKQWNAPGTVQFLQETYYHGWYGGVFPVARCLASICAYERLKFKPDEWTPEAQTVEVMSILDNAVFNPLHSELVEFVASGDRYHLHSSISPPSKVLKRAGQVGIEVLTKSKQSKANKSVSTDTINGFDRGISNGVLRGDSFPPQGGREYHQRVYEKRAEGLQF